MVQPLGDIRDADEGSATSDSSSDDSDEDHDDAETHAQKEGRAQEKQMEESGRRSQLLKRFVHQGDSHGSRLKDDVLRGVDRVRSRFDKDGDKARGIEKEV